MTITTALLSLATSTNLPNVAMTGEISLNQMVHAVGGIKEKVLAAKRAEIRKGEIAKNLRKLIFSRKLMIFSVFLPYDCQNAWDELDDKIKENVEIVFVRNYSEIQNHLFPNFPSS